MTEGERRVNLESFTTKPRAYTQLAAIAKLIDDLLNTVLDSTDAMRYRNNAVTALQEGASWIARLVTEESHGRNVGGG